ncbi:transposase [Belnapia rosea]|uniref:transposase n=1 Tax=Belnapia rosea TaxID=938405 RepID=UPI0015A0C125
MADLARRTKRYPIDLTDEEWAVVEPLLPRPTRRGRPPVVALREVLNAIRYLARADCVQHLPHVGAEWSATPCRRRQRPDRSAFLVHQISRVAPPTLKRCLPRPVLLGPHPFHLGQARAQTP